MKRLFTNKYTLIFCAFTVNLLLYGYEYGNNSYHDYLLAYIQKIIDPALYPKDLYLSTLRTFPSLYIYFMAFWAEFFSLESVHFIAYLLIKFLLFWITYNIAEDCFKSKTTAGLSVFLLSSAPTANFLGLFGGEPLIRPLLYQSTFIVPFLLLALHLFLKGQYLSSLCLLAVSYFFNGLMANYVVVMLFFASLMIWKNQSQHHKKLMSSAWLIFAALWLLWFTLTPKDSLSTAFEQTDFVKFLKNYYSAHYFPSTWNTQKWLTALTYLGWFVLSIYQSSLSAHYKKIVNGFLLALLTMWAAASIFGEIFPLRPLIALMFFRSDIFLIFFGLIAGADVIRQLLSASSEKKVLLGGLMLFALMSLQLYGTKTLLGLLVLFSLARLGDSLSWLKIVFRSLAVFCLLLVFFELHQPAQLKTQMILFVFLGFLILAKDSGNIKSIPPRAYLYSSIFIFLLLATYADVIFYRIDHRSLTYKPPLRGDWEDVQKWVQRHTGKDALFVVPPYVNGFRTFSQRSVFVEKIDGGAMHWNIGYEQKWAERLNELGYTDAPYLNFNSSAPLDPLVMQTRLIYAVNGEENFLRLKDKYGVEFVIEESFRQLSFPLIYQNQAFLVYRIPP